MAKGKYQAWLTEEGQTRLRDWARNGLTDEQIAKNMGIATGTLYEWKKKYPEIDEALKKGKEVVDAEVENSLHRRAMGFKEIVKKAFKVKKIDFDELGKKISEHEEIVLADEEVYVPPDTTAAIFWLKNRRPGSWRDKPDAGSGETEETGVVVLPPVMVDPSPQKDGDADG